MREILAPAGDKETAIVAINHGADAVYVGYRLFSARASATNFDDEELKELINYAHFFGAKVYVAMNTVVKDSELDEFLRVLLSVYQMKADAIIMQDIFLGKYVHEHYPEICLHLSTQAGVNNVGGAKLAKEFGFSRVILARETPIAEIREITKILETEVFVQGALCTCYSGQCYLSGFIGDNSGNRGRCKQPCRKKYQFTDAPSKYNGYPLSLADLCVGEDIDQLIEAGVSSFKIEGRMRRTEYVASAVRYYRDLLDGNDFYADFKALKRNFNRGNYTKGLAFGQDKKFISNQIQGHIGEKIGQIKGKIVLTKERGQEGDAYKIIRDGLEVCGGRFVKNEKGGILISTDRPVRDGDEVYITTDTRYLTLKDQKRTRRISLRWNFTEGEFPKATYREHDIEGDFAILSAQNRSLSETEIEANFSKIDQYPYEIDLDLTLNGNCFLPKSELNAFRRKVYQKIWDVETSRTVANYTFEPIQKTKGKEAKHQLMVMGTNFNFHSLVDVLIYKPNDYKEEPTAFLNFAKSHARKTALYVPGFLTAKDKEIISNLAKDFDLLYVEGLESLALANELSMKYIVGTGFNLTNSIDCAYFTSDIVLSKELDRREQSKLGGIVLTAGNLKVMDLLYCPFHKNCASCDQKSIHHIKDEDGRVFTIRRYQISSCRFEVYNCADLVTVHDQGILLDFTNLDRQQDVLNSLDQPSRLKEILPSFTSGHANHSVL